MNAFLAKLAESGLTPEHGEKLGMRHLTPEESNDIADHADQREGMLIPYFDIDGAERGKMWRLRYLEEEERSGFSALVKQKDKKNGQRYTQPAGAIPQAYFPPVIAGKTWRQFLDERDEHGRPNILVITEGEFKAACVTAHGHPTIGLGGVSNISSSKRLIDLIDDLEDIEWASRLVLLVFDADIIDKVPVQQALLKLSDKLVERGAVVKNVRIPADQPSKGADDYIVEHGIEEFEVLLSRAEEFATSRELHQVNTEFVLVRSIETFIEIEKGYRYRRSGFELALANRFIKRWSISKDNPKMEEVPVAKEWMGWPHRHEVEGIVYSPGAGHITDQNNYNLWSGWAVEAIEGDVTLWQKLLDHVFSGDRQKIEWFERWVAYPIQNPGAKMLSAAVIWGVRQGTGKSLIGDIIGRIYGDGEQMGDRANYSCISSGDLDDDYNDWLAGKQFIHGDEIAGGDKRANAEKVKRMITSQQVRVRQKYVASFTIQDCANYYFTSNHPDPIHVERDDRRLFIHEVTADRLIEEVVRPIVDWGVYSDEGPQALMHYFLSMDLGEFNPSAPAPVTEDRNEMIRFSGSELDGWIMDVIENPENILAVEGETASDIWRPGDLLKAFDPEEKGRVKVLGMSKALKRAGISCSSKQIKVAGKLHRFYFLRNADRWLEASNQEISEHWTKFYKRGVTKY